MTHLLAFDTCFNACSVAIGVRSDAGIEIVTTRFESMATGQAERLLPMISNCFAEAKLSMNDIGTIVVTTGPGTFTGTRIGISAAKGLALVNQVPVVGLSSMHLMARHVALANVQSSDIAIVIDVRRNEVYHQLFDKHGLKPRTKPELMSVAQAREVLSSSECVLFGNGAALVASHSQAQLLRNENASELLPDARYALNLGLIRNLSEAAILPLYLRAPDAKPSSVPSLQRY